MLGTLLKHADEKPYFLRHGSGRESRCLILLRVEDADVAALGEAGEGEPVVIKMGKFRFVPLPLSEQSRIGTIDSSLYDAERGQWTGTVALMPYR